MSTCSVDIPCLTPVKRGDTWDLQFAWTDSNGTAVDLTDYTGRMQVRTRKTAELVAEADTVALDADPTTGLVTATFEPVTTAAVDPGSYYTDLELTHTGGKVMSSGTVLLTVLEDITLPAEV